MTARQVPLPAAERFVDRRLAACQHRLKRPPNLQAELPQCVAPTDKRGLRGHRQRAAEHDRPPHLGARHLGGLGDGIGHHPVKRPLPQFPGEQPDEEVLLVGGGRGEQFCHEPFPLSRGPLARHGPDLRKRLVHGENSQRRCLGGMRH